jgi:hypothetical protein
MSEPPTANIRERPDDYDDLLLRRSPRGGAESAPRQPGEGRLTGGGSDCKQGPTAAAPVRPRSGNPYWPSASGTR